VTAKAHGRTIDIQGITVAKVNDKVQLQSVETWFDPMEMFRQISPDGSVTKAALSTPAAGEDITTQLHGADPDGHDLEKLVLRGGGGRAAARAAHEEMMAQSGAGACPFLSRQQ